MPFIFDLKILAAGKTEIAVFIIFPEVSGSVDAVKLSVVQWVLCEFFR